MLETSLRSLRVGTLLVQIFFIAHLLACGWFLTTWIHDEDLPTWIDIYDGGSAADGPVSEQYYFSFYCPSPPHHPAA